MEVNYSLEQFPAIAQSEIKSHTETAEAQASAIIPTPTFELARMMEENDSLEQFPTITQSEIYSGTMTAESHPSPELEIDFSTITEDVIMDKSKGDMVAKLLVVMQTSWFMVQCISRVAEGLPVTELELTTLGHTIFISVVYFFWWNKPLDVRYPITLPTKRRITDHVASKVGGANSSRTRLTVDNKFNKPCTASLPTVMAGSNRQFPP
jgi:hypothetical protein